MQPCASVLHGGTAGDSIVRGTATAPSSTAGKLRTACVTLFRAHLVSVVTLCDHGVLRRQSRLARHAMSAAARLISQPLQPLLQKPLHPLVDKATADPDRGRHLRKGHPISDQQNNPAASGQPGAYRRCPLPGQQRPALGRCEADREGGGASTSHSEDLPIRRICILLLQPDRRATRQREQKTCQAAHDITTVCQQNHEEWDTAYPRGGGWGAVRERNSCNRRGGAGGA